MASMTQRRLGAVPSAAVLPDSRTFPATTIKAVPQSRQHEIELGLNLRDALKLDLGVGAQLFDGLLKVDQLVGRDSGQAIRATFPGLAPQTSWPARSGLGGRFRFPHHPKRITKTPRRGMGKERA